MFKVKPKTRKHIESPHALARDLDGYVHTRKGFMSEREYRRLRDENPGVGLPAHEDLPLISDE